MTPDDDTGYKALEHIMAQLYAHEYFSRTGNRILFEAPLADKWSVRHFLGDDETSLNISPDVKEAEVLVEAARRVIKVQKSKNEISESEYNNKRVKIANARNLLLSTDEKYFLALKDPIRKFGEIDLSATAAKHNIMYQRLMAVAKAKRLIENLTDGFEVEVPYDS